MDEDTGLVRSAVGYPLAGDEARSRLLLGAGLHFVGAIGVALAAALLLSDLVAPVLAIALAAGVVLVGYVPLLGYTAATVRSLLGGEADPPTVGDWSAMLRDGRRVATVVALYGAPAVLLASAAVALGGLGADAPAGALAAAGLAAVAALVALYVLPAAVVNVVETGVTSGAWDRATLADAVGDGRYLGPWLLGVGGATVGGVVGAPLAVVLVGLPVLFATQVATTHAVTHGVVRSLEWTLEEPPAPPASGYIPEWEDGSRRKELSEGRLGGSLLPTTPDEDDEAEETPPTPGSLATTDDDGSTATDLERPDGGPDRSGHGSGGSEATADAESGDAGSDIERYEEDGEDD